VLARQHELPALVVDGDRCDHDAVVAVRLQAGDRERRVQGVPGVHLDQEGAGLLEEADEHLADDVRDKVAPGAVNASTWRPWTTGATCPCLRAHSAS
jgi:hypothetical protein